MSAIIMGKLAKALSFCSSVDDFERSEAEAIKIGQLTSVAQNNTLS